MSHLNKENEGTPRSNKTDKFKKKGMVTYVEYISRWKKRTPDKSLELTNNMGYVHFQKLPVPPY
jgi:hypothetical protein